MMLLALEHLYYVDADGTPFRTAQAEDLNYPILTGIRPDLAQNQPDHARAVIAGALRFIMPYHHPVVVLTISAKSTSAQKSDLNSFYERVLAWSLGSATHKPLSID